jgi:putative PIN family toxin of toxin-antitoxin system
VRVFLDTNVLVSAFVSRGLCTDLLKVVLGEHELVVSNLVVEELERVLRDKLRAPEFVFERALSILDHVEVVSSGPEFDENDDTILAAAVESEADIFVTGDQKLLAAAKRSPIPAVSPRRFMVLLRVPRDSPDRDGEPRVSEHTPGGVREKAFAFALTIITLCKTLEEGREEVLARQLLRAGTGIGAGLEELGTAENRRDFDCRMAGALRKAHETKYWLRLLSESGVALEIDFEPYVEICLELIRLLDSH